MKVQTDWNSFQTSSERNWRSRSAFWWAPTSPTRWRMRSSVKPPLVRDLFSVFLAKLIWVFVASTAYPFQKPKSNVCFFVCLLFLWWTKRGKKWGKWPHFQGAPADSQFSDHRCSWERYSGAVWSLKGLLQMSYLFVFALKKSFIIVLIIVLTATRIS